MKFVEWERETKYLVSNELHALILHISASHISIKQAKSKGETRKDECFTQRYVEVLSLTHCQGSSFSGNLSHDGCRPWPCAAAHASCNEHQIATLYQPEKKGRMNNKGKIIPLIMIMMILLVPVSSVTIIAEKMIQRAILIMLRKTMKTVAAVIMLLISMIVTMKGTGFDTTTALGAFKWQKNTKVATG